MQTNREVKDGMFEIDKARFGTFVATLRREKGLTQKELAGQLLVSDKAVSKWETGASLPDTGLLIPLADALGVTVTELLMGERMKEALEADQVEGVVKAAIAYAGEKPKRAYQAKDRWMGIYGLSLVMGGVGVYLNTRFAQPALETLKTVMLLYAVFGAYFCCFVTLRLPDDYDRKPTSFFYDGAFRMNVPGVRFSNGNWPHIVRAVRLCMCLGMILMPALSLALGHAMPALWAAAGRIVLVALSLCGVFVPIYLAGKKYE